MKGLKKAKLCLNSNVKFRVLYDTKKMSFHSNIKDKVTCDERNNAIYKIKCPGCKICDIGKTERCLITRITEHGTKETELMFKNLSECELFKDCCRLYSLSSLFSKDEHDDIFLASYIFNVILQNHEVLDSNRNWSQVAFSEAHYVKNRDSIINYGLKASKEPLRFN